MKKLISMILILTFAFGVIGCENNSSKKYMKQGKVQLENKQYEKSLESFQLAISKDSENQEAILLSGMIEGYLKGKKYIKESDLDNAKETLDNIDKDYKKYSIKDDIDSLKSEVDKQLTQKEELNKNQQAKATNSDKKVSSESEKTNQSTCKDNKTENVENNTDKDKQSKNNTDKSNKNKNNTEGEKSKSFSEDDAKQIARKKYDLNTDLQYIVTKSGVENGIKYYNIIVKSVSMVKKGGSGTVDNIKVFENGTIKYNKGA